MTQLLPTCHNMPNMKLIALVRDQSVLWDKGDENYKNRIEKGKAWPIVAEGIVENFSQFPATKKNKQRIFLKNLKTNPKYLNSKNILHR